MMEFDDNKPIYLQLADQIMDEVERQEFDTGERLLSVREYAAKTGVNANTVMRTYTWLQQEGIIYNKRGIGFFYEQDARQKVLMMRRQIFFVKEMPYFLERMFALGVTLQDFTYSYDSYLKKRRDKMYEEAKLKSKQNS